MTATVLRAALAVGLLVAGTTDAAAQALSIRASGDVGTTVFTAGDSFDAMFGSRRATVVGGGAEVVLPTQFFVGVRVSRVEKTGTRLFVDNGDVFDLGIRNTVTITPVELTAGYRFGRSRLVPYAGGGLGWHRYQEEDEFATDADRIRETFTGYHVLGGAEVRLGAWIAAAAEVQWTTVPDALGTDPAGVSAAFGDTDLGGTSVRVKVIVGR